MTHRRIALIVSLACTAVLMLAPVVASAGRSQGRPGGGAVAHGRPSGFGFHRGGGFHQGGAIHHVAPRPFHGGPRHFGGRPFVRRVVTTGVIGAPLVYYAPSLGYASPFAYDAAGYDAPLAYAPSAPSYGANTGGALSLAPAPLPSVVEFPTGRYELRGDGTTMPYTWVWIPNPPPLPPDASSSQAPNAGPPLSSPRQAYRWTDEAGVAHWTDRLDAVPQPYRAEAQQPRVR